MPPKPLSVQDLQSGIKETPFDTERPIDTSAYGGWIDTRSGKVVYVPKMHHSSYISHRWPTETKYMDTFQKYMYGFEQGLVRFFVELEAEWAGHRYYKVLLNGWLKDDVVRAWNRISSSVYENDEIAAVGFSYGTDTRIETFDTTNKLGIARWANSPATK